MAEKLAHAIAYADGSCIGNPGPGGWGVVIINPDGATRTLSGANPSTTNNRMEITAAIEALRAFSPAATVTLRSDSQYVVKTMTAGWKRKENLDLWRQLDAEAARRKVIWEWVRGHAGDEFNGRADELARTAASRAMKGGRRPTAAALHAPISGDDYEDEWSSDELNPLLRPGEDVRHCRACRRSFVTADDSRYCSLATCQIKARRAPPMKP
jgi:ribonuclease HI